MLIRRYIIAGLLVWLPIWVTYLVVSFLIDVMDGTLNLIPMAYQPDTLLGFHIPGLGLLFSVAIVFVTGIFVVNFYGHKLVTLWERILDKIPLVRSIYNGSKQVFETLFSTGGQSFRKVLLVEYPRKGMWSLGFQTSMGNEEIRGHIGVPIVTIFIPTTPNPTSGFLMAVPRTDVIELDMSVDDGLKMIISLGVVQPKPMKAQG